MVLYTYEACFTISVRLEESGRHGDRERETVRHMLSRQPTFQLSDRVSHELKVICRLIDGGGLRLDGVNSEYHSYKSRQFPLPSFFGFLSDFGGDRLIS